MTRVGVARVSWKMAARSQARGNRTGALALGVVLTGLVVAQCAESSGSETSDPCAGASCEDRNECTSDQCDPATGLCRFMQLEDGARCSEGICWSGDCQEIGSVWPCTRRGIETAIEEGGGPYTFACEAPTTVIFDHEVVIDRDVSLDGEGNLELRGGGRDRVLHVLRGATVELRGLAITGGRPQTDAAVSSFGGGIWNEGGALTLVDVSLYANLADVGAGILNAGGLTIVNSTLSGNLGTIAGGAIFDSFGVSLINTTISSNVAETGSALSIGAWVTLESTVIDGSCVGTLAFSLGYNVESPADTCNLGLPGDRFQVSTEELALGELSIDVGVLRTHTPASESVLLDVVPPEACATDVDQRGVRRPQGEGCDVGAVERVLEPSE